MHSRGEICTVMSINNTSDSEMVPPSSTAVWGLSIQVDVPSHKPSVGIFEQATELADGICQYPMNILFHVFHENHGKIPLNPIYDLLIPSVNYPPVNIPLIFSTSHIPS